MCIKFVDLVAGHEESLTWLHSYWLSPIIIDEKLRLHCRILESHIDYGLDSNSRSLSKDLSVFLIASMAVSTSSSMSSRTWFSMVGVCLIDHLYGKCQDCNPCSSCSDISWSISGVMSRCVSMLSIISIGCGLNYRLAIRFKRSVTSCSDKYPSTSPVISVS